VSNSRIGAAARIAKLQALTTDRGATAAEAAAAKQAADD